MKKLIILLCSAICASALAACTAPESNDKISVYTSFYAMYDFAREIGGDKINLYNICPVGTEPHDFEPTAADMAKISAGDVFIYNGLGMESWTDSVIDTLNSSDIISVNTSDNTDAAESIQDVHHHADVHIWLNPSDAYLQMEAIAEGLAKADPKNAEYYAGRLDKCKEKINLLIADYTQAAAQFSSFDIITSHEAYGSLCEAFNLTQLAINGVDNAHDPTPSHLAEIIDYIKSNNIEYIFTEPLGTSSIVESIAEDTGCEILVLDPFEGSTENKDYFTVMYENLSALTTALTGGQNGNN